MNYRYKILLSITEVFGGDLSATDFQKLLFIFSDNQSERSFNFVPYKYGCFSFQAVFDKNKLSKEGYFSNSNNWTLVHKDKGFVNTLNDLDRKQLFSLKDRFGNSSTSELIKYVYLNYPYFAINSEIASKHLSTEEIKVIQQFKPKDNSTFLFTIGYEGLNLEQYLNKLIQNNTKVLCDVRKNAISRKYGFSKSTLKKACETVNIKYLHIPELGIISDKRKALKRQEDYEELFKDYLREIIPDNQTAVNSIIQLIEEYKRVALTCFESSHKQCHRMIVAEEIKRLDDSIPVKHI